MKRAVFAALVVVLVTLGLALGVAGRASADSPLPPTPTVWTDKADYAPEETVIITGSGFADNVTLTVRVTRPDGTVVKGDGEFAPGSDNVTTDAGGGFIYEYILDGIFGLYTVDVLSGDIVLATTTFTDAAVARPLNLTATTVSPSRIDLSWQDDSTNEDDFHIERGPLLGSFVEIATVGGSSPASSRGGTFTFSDTGLTPNTTYEYRVRAHKNEGNHYSLYSNTASSATLNTPPVARSDSYGTNEDTPLSIAAAGVLGNDTDADGDSLTAIKVTDPSHGSLSLLANGSFTYAPSLNYNGSDSFTYKANDGRSDSNDATVTINVTAVNDVPSFTKGPDQNVLEDAAAQSVAWATGISAGPADESGQALDFIVTNNNNGLFSVQPAIAADGTLTYTLMANANGSAIVSVSLHDDGGTLNGGVNTSAIQTFNINVTAVNDAPTIGSGTLASQTVQYSDRITAGTIIATDVDSTTLSVTGLPAGVTATEVSYSGAGTWLSPYTITWNISGAVTAGPGSFALSVSDGTESTSADVTITVVREDARVDFPDSNPTSVQVATPGGSAGPFTITVNLSELPDLPTQLASPGDLTKILAGTVKISLVPVGPGSGTVPLSMTLGSVSGTGDYKTRTATCTFAAGLAVNTYQVIVTVDGLYYYGTNESVVVVFDPSLGFTTGGGWFYWPDTANSLTGYPGDKTNFGFNMKYNKSGKGIQGSLLLIRHTEFGEMYRVKSNALDGLAIGQDIPGTMGWASFSGKCTYSEPGVDNKGGIAFKAYVEDWAEPGKLVDKFWISVDGGITLTPQGYAGTNAGLDNAIVINQGNIVVPHQAKGHSAIPPTVTSVGPTNSGSRNHSYDVVITGVGFTGAASTSVSFGAGITVTNVVVVDDNHITATITIASNATLGTRTVSVTGANGLTGSLNKGFTVV